MFFAKFFIRIQYERRFSVFLESYSVRKPAGGKSFERTGYEACLKKMLKS